MVDAKVIWRTFVGQYVFSHVHHSTSDPDFEGMDGFSVARGEACVASMPEAISYRSHSAGNFRRDAEAFGLASAPRHPEPIAL